MSEYSSGARVTDVFSLYFLLLIRDWDTDGNGQLDRGEFQDAMKRLQLPVTDEEAGSVFDSWDEL